MIATREVGAQPIAAAAALSPTTPAVSARPPARAQRPKKPLAIATPVAAPTPAPAPAPEARGELLQHRWPNVPFDRHLSMSEMITERITEIGNRFGDHLDLLSRDMFQLRVDGRRRRAHVRLGGGGGTGDPVTFQIDGDIQFDDLNARVDAHIDLGIGRHLLRLDLPAFQIQAGEYRGDYGVQVEVPMFEKRF